MPVCFGFNGRGYSLFVPVDIGRQDTDVPAAGETGSARRKDAGGAHGCKLGVGGAGKIRETLCVRCEKSLFFDGESYMVYYSTRQKSLRL